jgi:hypothetical protein
VGRGFLVTAQWARLPERHRKVENHLFLETVSRLHALGNTVRDQLVPIARPDHPRLKAESKPLTLRQFCAEPMIVREVGSGTIEVIDRALAKRGQKVQRPPLVLGSTEAIKRAVAAGLEVAIVSDLTIQTELTAGQLAILPLQGFQLTRPLHRLCWRKRARDPATLAFSRAVGSAIPAGSRIRAPSNAQRLTEISPRNQVALTG